MKNFIWALIISIIIHLVLLYSFKDIKKPIPKTAISQKDTTVYTHIQLASIKKIIKPKPIIKEKNKKKQRIYKKVKKKTIKPIKKKRTVYKKIKKKKIKKAIKKSVFTQKPIKENIKELELLKKQLQIKQELQELRHLDSLTQNYIKLYGNEYFNLPSNVKKYLKENLNEIGRITQQYLRYPSIAIKTRQAGTSILEFTLRPNGDIVNLKIIGSSSYQVLDKNSIKTIKVAYKDYPRPTEDTLVRIYVSYRLK